MSRSLLERLLSENRISHLDFHFGSFIGRLSERDAEVVSTIAVLVSNVTMAGHICFHFREMGPGIVRELLFEEGFPDLSEWPQILFGSGVVGHPGDFKPLILDESGRCYLYRYWEYENQLVGDLKLRMRKTLPLVQPKELGEELNELFPYSGSDSVDWQKVAAFASLLKTFCVISGGPGTGKTTTVAKILALLIKQSGSGKLRIALAAPTGKAAMRLETAIRTVKSGLAIPEEISQAIPETASTIHRLLGSIDGSPYFRFNRENLLRADVLVVDEASMIDLPLMAKLMQAFPVETRVILLGDKDQLASVEAGAVLGDICNVKGKGLYSKDFAEACYKVCSLRLPPDTLSLSGDNPATDSIVYLQKNYRFSDKSGIARLSGAVRDGDTDAMMAILRSGDYEDLSWHDLPPSKTLPETMLKELEAGFQGYFQMVADILGFSPKYPVEKLGALFESLNDFRVLCAVREGKSGIFAMNRAVEHIFAKLVRVGRSAGLWYPGRAVIIGRNDYNLRLFNGDTGIYLGDGGVVFPGDENSFRFFHPYRIPENQTVYAMTVHKSQGSEFNKVVLVLPTNDSPLLTRELIYTAVTRARERLSIWASEKILRTAVERLTTRISGLADALWG